MLPPGATRTVVRAVAVALAVTVTGSVPALGSPGRDHAAEAFSATNRARESHERRVLGHGTCLQRKAARQAARMAARERMFHQDLGGVLRACDLTKVGENVAYGYDRGEDAVRAWMASPSHRRNLLDRDYRTMGLASRRSEDGTFYTAQLFGRR